MGYVSHLSLIDANQKQITGGSTIFDREGSIEVHKINYNVSRNLDSQTGKAHSIRRHQPFSILKSIDCSTPELFQYCTSGKLIPEARIDLYNIDNEGCERNYFSYILENVRIISISPHISALTDAQDMESVSLSFERITLAYHEGNRIAVDAWENR